MGAEPPRKKLHRRRVVARRPSRQAEAKEFAELMEVEEEIR
jgi:hypothetical protein